MKHANDAVNLPYDTIPRKFFLKKLLLFRYIRSASMSCWIMAQEPTLHLLGIFS